MKATKQKEYIIKQENGVPLEITSILSGILSPATLGLLTEKEKDENEYHYWHIEANKLFRKLAHQRRMKIQKIVGCVHRYLKNGKIICCNHSRIKLKRRY